MRPVVPAPPPPPECANGRVFGILICSTCGAIARGLDRQQGEGAGGIHVDHVAAAEPALERLLEPVHVATAAPHRIVRIAVFVVHAGGGGIVGERLAVAALHRRRVHGAEVVRRLLHQHHAIGRGVVPGVAGRLGRRARDCHTGEATRSDPPPEVPQVMVEARRHTAAQRGGQVGEIAPGHGGLDRPDDLAADVLFAVGGFDEVLPDRTVGGAGAVQLAFGVRLGQVDATAKIDQHEGEPTGLERLIADQRMLADLNLRRGHLHHAIDLDAVGARLAPDINQGAGLQRRWLGEQQTLLGLRAGGAQIVVHLHPAFLHGQHVTHHLAADRARWHRGRHGGRRRFGRRSGRDSPIAHQIAAGRAGQRQAAHQGQRQRSAKVRDALRRRRGSRQGSGGAAVHESSFFLERWRAYVGQEPRAQGPGGVGPALGRRLTPTSPDREVPPH